MIHVWLIAGYLVDWTVIIEQQLGFPSLFIEYLLIYLYGLNTKLVESVMFHENIGNYSNPSKVLTETLTVVLRTTRVLFRGTSEDNYGGCTINTLLFAWISVFPTKNVVSFELLTFRPTFLQFCWILPNSRICQDPQNGRLFERWFCRWRQITSRRAISSNLETGNRGLNSNNMATNHVCVVLAVFFFIVRWIDSIM